MNRRRLAARVGVGVVLLAVVLAVARIDARALLEAVRSTDVRLLAFAATGAPALLALRAWRWSVLLRGVGIDVPFRAALRLTGAGILLGQVTPAQVGDLGRAYALKERGRSGERSVVSVAYDRAFDLGGELAVLLLASVAATTAFETVGVAAGVAATGLFAGAVALASRRRLHDGASRLLRAFGLPGDAPPPDGRALRAAAGIAACGAVGKAGVLLALAYAVGATAYVPVVLAVVAGAGLVRLLPVSVGGLGTRDAYFVAASGTLGFAPERAVWLSTLFFLYPLLTGVCGLLLPGGRPDA